MTPRRGYHRPHGRPISATRAAILLRRLGFRLIRMRPHAASVYHGLHPHTFGASGLDSYLR